MFIADTHSDTLHALGVEKKPLDSLMINPDKLRAGHVSMQTFALWTGSRGNRGDVDGIVRGELEARHFFTDAGIPQVDDPEDAPEDKCSFMLSVEGGEVFEKGIETVEYYRSLGVRMAALLWNNENSIGFPAKGGSKEGLTDYGVQVVREMQRVGMAVDTSHLNEQGFWDIFLKTNRVPLASHSCCSALCPHFRNLTDEQLRLLIREKGYVGINFYPYFLSKDGHATLETVAEHIDYVCQMGGEEIVGFGSDFDGIECAPEGLEGADKVPALMDALRRRGFPEKVLAGIAGENLRGYFRRMKQ
ncbi:MAG: membrane dipeptidase [Clostridia bacterium]|nr:membrane dipeptidase [Clostridia bacterium]